MNNTNTQESSGMVVVDSSKRNTLQYSGIFMGIFWMISGGALLLNNVFSFSLQVILIILFVMSIYLIIFSALYRIRKIYFVLGLVLLAIFFSTMVIGYGKSQLRWPIIMVGFGLGIILYGSVFKKDTNIKYIIPGIILLCIGLLVFLTAVGDRMFSFSEFLYKFWPIFLVFFGLYQMRESYLKKYRKKQNRNLKEESKSEVEV